MAALAQEFPESHLHTVDLPYRFSSWGMDDPENIRLWEDEQGRLMGWAVLQAPFWTVDIACRPDIEASLFPKILVWADQRAIQAATTPNGHPTWYINVFAGQSQRIQSLIDAGFADQSRVGEDSWSKVLMKRSAQVPLRRYPAPEGFTVRPLAGKTEVAAYVDLHRSVFESRNMSAEWRLRTLRHSAYQKELDIVVEAPDKHLAAFCIGWLSKGPDAGLIGQIEPLGCHKDYRRNALGRVALAEVLQRMQALGAESILVETDNHRNTALALYESLGFRVIQDVLVFRKDYGM